MRSTLRRNAMATPASVRCVSRQLVFDILSCTGLKRKVWHPRHHGRVTIHIISYWIGRSSWNVWIWSSSCSSWIWILQTVASIHVVLLVPQLCNLDIENLSTPSRSKHQFSSQHSNLYGTCNLCHHTAQCHRPSSCTLQQTTTVCITGA